MEFIVKNGFEMWKIFLVVVIERSFFVIRLFVSILFFRELMNWLRNGREDNRLFWNKVIINDINIWWFINRFIVIN